MGHCREGFWRDRRQDGLLEIVCFGATVTAVIPRKRASSKRKRWCVLVPRFHPPIGKCWVVMVDHRHIGGASASEYAVRAAYSERSVRVYQAYRPGIALPALKAGQFVPPFSMRRMTWIKPSFNWMIYRSNYATKPGQEIVLGIEITREGFEWALKNAVLSRFTPSIHSSSEKWKQLLAAKPVRIQWDPERDWRLQSISGVRAIQVGLSGEAVERYVKEWVVQIEDVTPKARMVAIAAESGFPPSALPSTSERLYPLDAVTVAAICPR